MYADMTRERTELTSSRNPLLQKIRKALESGHPTEEGWVVAEGPHLLEEALRSSCVIDMIFVAPHAKERYSHLLVSACAEIVNVSERALSAVAGTESTQGILAAVRLPTWSWADLMHDPAGLVVLDGIQDPGNAGAMVRSAEAFGGTGVVFLEGSVRATNGKVLRASAGSIFRVPFLAGVARDELLRRLKGSDIRVCALSARAGVVFTDISFRTPFALVTGAEGSGISTEIACHAEMISIPMVKVESLNVAVACSLVLFEAARQRRGA